MKFFDLKWQSLNIKTFPKAKEVDAVLFVATKENIKNLSSVGEPYQTRIKGFLERRKEPLKSGDEFFLPSTVSNQGDLGILVLPEEQTAFSILSAFRAPVKKILSPSAQKLNVVLHCPRIENLVAECFAAAVAARIADLPLYGKKAKERKSYVLKEVRAYSTKNVARFLEYGFESTQGGNLVRYLGVMPPNFLTAEAYGKTIRKLAFQAGLSLKFYSNAQLKKMGAGAFTAVDQGDPDSRGGIYEITYSPKSSRHNKFVSLVGKGLCFDTGGYNVKTGDYMTFMKGDMQGSAVALAAVLVAARLKWPLKLKAYLAVTENHLSPKAYKADDVVTALNGLSIEVINTDAEGRMVLADTLYLASRAKPGLVMDFATLTGMASYAIGSAYGAGFTNEDSFHKKIIEAGRQSGDRVWTFPLDKDYGESLKSTVADTLQCAKGRSADHILAAYFLSQFIEKGVPWVHLDLSAADREGGLAHVDSLFTGFGVRFALQFLKNQYRLGA